MPDTCAGLTSPNAETSSGLTNFLKPCASEYWCQGVARCSELSEWLNKVIQGDCLALLPQLPNACIDLMVTDPPYGLSIFKNGWDKAVPAIRVWNECLRVLKPGAIAFVMCSPRQDRLSEMIANLQGAGFYTKFTSLFWEYHTGFPKITDISKIIDKKLGVKPEVIGTKKQNGQKFRPNNGGFNDTTRTNYNITRPTSEQAKAMSGGFAGFHPRPAVEIILAVMKPLSKKSFTDQALENGKGLTWLYDGSIPYQGHMRFPANLLISNDILDRGEYPQVRISSSQYYSLDQWFHTRLKTLPYNVERSFPFLIVPKPSTAEKSLGLEKWEKKVTHPTVKPISLFSYLITLGSRPGDTVLDPYLGSGTAAIAAKMLGRNYVGIEIESAYCRIAKRRLRMTPEP